MPNAQFLGLSLLLASWSLASEAALRPLTLGEALSGAESRNPQVQGARHAVEQAQGDSSSALGRMLPEVTLSARMTMIDEPIILNLDPIRSAMLGLHASNPDGTVNAPMYQYLDAKLPHFQSEVQSDLYYNATLNALWPIFAGGRLWANYQANRSAVEARKADLSLAQNSVAMETCSRYFTLRLAEELVRLREETYQNLEAHVQRAERLEAGGQIAMAERLRAEVALAEAERERADALRDQTLARLALASTIGTDTLLQAVTPLEAVKSPGELKAWQDKALSQHPGLKRLEVESHRAENGVDAARGEWLPSVALFGKKELYTEDLTLFEPEWAVGVNLQWNLFSGGQTRGKTQAAKSQLRSLESLREKTRNDVNLLVEKRWRELAHAQDRLQSLDKTGELADESLRAQQRAFEAGIATSLDVVDAQLALSRLRVARLKALYDANMALAGLFEATGETKQIAVKLESNP